MKKSQLRKAIKEIIKEMIDANQYASATLTTQGPGRSRFTKTGRAPGVMEDEGDNYSMAAGEIANSFTFDEMAQLHQEKKISSDEYEKAKLLLQVLIDTDSTYKPGKGDYREKYINKF